MSIASSTVIYPVRCISSLRMVFTSPFSTNTLLPFISTTSFIMAQAEKSVHEIIQDVLNLQHEDIKGFLDVSPARTGGTV